MKKFVPVLVVFFCLMAGVAPAATEAEKVAFEAMIDRAQANLIRLIYSVPDTPSSKGFGEFREQIMAGKIQIDLRPTRGHGGVPNAASIFCSPDEKGKRKYGLGASYEWLLMPGLTDESRLMTLYHEYTHWSDYQSGLTEASLCERGIDKSKSRKTFLLSELRANEAECSFGRSLGWDHPDRHCQQYSVDREGFLSGVLRRYRVEDAEAQKLLAEYLQKRK